MGASEWTAINTSNSIVTLCTKCEKSKTKWKIPLSELLRGMVCLGSQWSNEVALQATRFSKMLLSPRLAFMERE